MAERRLDQLNAQGLANTAWAFATVGQKDEQLFKALSRAAEQRVGDFMAKQLGMTLWALSQPEMMRDALSLFNHAEQMGI